MPDRALEEAAEALVEGARENGLAIIPWSVMAEGPKEANRNEARRCISAYLGSLRRELPEHALRAAARSLSPQVETLGYGREQFAETVISGFLAALTGEGRDE